MTQLATSRPIATPPGEKPDGGPSLREVLPKLGPVIALVVTCTFFASQTPRFATGSNLSLVVQQTIVVAVIAIGQTLIILTAGVDLSCGQVMGLGGIVMTTLAVQSNFNPYLAIALGIATCVGFGLANGLLITTFRLPPFIVTLGMLDIAFTLAHRNSASVTNLPAPLTFFGNTFTVAGTAITYGSVFTIMLFLVAWFALTQTAGGRHIYAVGNNQEAARRSGVRVNRVLISVYAIAGVTYGLAALLLVARTGAGDPQAGATENLESITAVVIGGTSLFGGRGGVMGTLIGAFVLAIIRNGLLLIGVQSIYTYMVTGVLVILAVTVDQLTHRGQS